MNKQEWKKEAERTGDMILMFVILSVLFYTGVIYAIYKLITYLF